MLTPRIVVLCLLAVPLAAQGYRLPPPPILRCVDVEPPPRVTVSPTGSHLLLSRAEAMPSIAVQARPMLRLAGLRIDPATRGRPQGRRVFALTLVDVATGEQRPVKLPADAAIGSQRFSADGRYLAFTNTRDDRIELWILDVTTAEARRIDDLRLVGTLGSPIQWMPDQRSLLCKLAVVGTRQPQRPAAPKGPVIQETAGRKSPVRTYQDLLANEYDAALFEHFATSQLAVVGVDGAARQIGAPGILTASPSPDGKLLLVTRIKRPFSYSLPAGSFPKDLLVLDRDGTTLARVADLPLAAGIPLSGVPLGPRQVRWLPSSPSTLVWCEALDGGDPRAKATQRDRVVLWPAPFAADGRVEWTRTRDRFAGVTCSRDGKVALLQDDSWFERRYRTLRLDATDPGAKPAVVWEGSTQDAYRHPGTPATFRGRDGQAYLRLAEGKILVAGAGASPEGDHPFLDRMDLQTGERTRLFHCAKQSYETVVATLDDEGHRFILRRESKTAPPNYVLVDKGEPKGRALTAFADPAARLTSGITRRPLRYQREDGVPLTGTLYLPPGHKPGDKLPLLVWAYPREFGSTKNAGQVRGSFHRYSRLAGTSPLLLALAGYAVLDNASMPVVGPHRTANDTFVPQLIAGAKAAIAAAAATGDVDPERAAIAGHSYGAFMTANLLAHSDLFRAGIARSGAYNRTLTPFGFQNERRTYWQAPEIYHAMSPFMHAPAIDEPLLMIHGEVDNNSGTFPIQSQRMFHAMKGNGGTARLVVLPHESHGYRARESVLHCLAEMVDWLDTHVKKAGPRRKVIEASTKK